jgi:cyclic pyranopterin monophosphate synthase
MLSHIDDNNQPAMVDVGKKEATPRTAMAESIVYLPAEVMRLLKDGELVGKKGPVFQTAVIAGTMAAKRTSELIPLCHPISIENCKIEIASEELADGCGLAVIQCSVSICHKTGVEMEALTGASIAALTIYDMCKAVTHDIEIRATRLISKHGGRRDFERNVDVQG